MKRGMISPEQRTELRKLYEQARTVNGATPTDSPARAASVRLVALLNELRRTGVPLVALDEACGARPGMSRMRLRRHGVLSRSPSMTGYKGIEYNAAKDITGQKFGELTAIEPAGRGGSNGRSVVWLCHCDHCDKDVRIPRSDLVSGRAKACTIGTKPRWTSLELNLLGQGDLSDRELSALLERSEMSIRSKRSKLRRRSRDD
jgi:hypothetical protein